MTVAEIINASLRKIGALSSGETIETARQNEALSALQAMLRAWSVSSISTFVTVREEFTLTGGKDTYTWGLSGDFASVRPHYLVGAYISNGGVITPVDIINEEMFMRKADATALGITSKLLYRPTYPLGTVMLRSIPSGSDTLITFSFKPFPETGSFEAVGDSVQFPVHYQEPIIYNLAIRLAPEYGRTASREVVSIANSSYDVLCARNAAEQLKSVSFELPVLPYYSGYSINVG